MPHIIHDIVFTEEELLVAINNYIRDEKPGFLDLKEFKVYSLSRVSVKDDKIHSQRITELRGGIGKNCV